MRRPRTHLLLVLLAAALFVWGVLRALARSDPAVIAWTTFAMAGLLVLAAVNGFVSVRKVGTLVLVISALFAALVAAAAVLAFAAGTSEDIPAVARALLFFILTGAAGGCSVGRVPGDLVRWAAARASGSRPARPWAWLPGRPLDGPGYICWPPHHRGLWLLP